MIPTGPLHPELVAVGLLLGGMAGAALTWRGRGSDRSSLDTALSLAAAVVTVVLVVEQRISPWATAGVAAALWWGSRRNRPRWAAPLGAVAVLVPSAVVLAPRTTAGPVLVGLLALLLAAAHGPARAGALLPVVLAALAGTWAGAPDTEVAALVGAALVGVAATVPRWWRAQDPPSVPRWSADPRAALAVLLVWSAADGYRGRPGGVGGSIVALVTVAAWTAAVAHAPARPPFGWRLVTGWAVAAATTAVAARTVGLERSLGSGPALVVGLAVVGAGSALLGTGVGFTRRAGGRRSPA